MNPRLGIVVHPDNLYPQAGETKDKYLGRLIREFQQIKALGFGRIRWHFDAKDLLSKDNATVSDWGKLYAETVLQAIQGLGMKCDVTLPEPKVGATLEQNMLAHKYVMDTACGIFAKDDVTFIPRNEPDKWAEQKPDPETKAIVTAGIKHWDEKKYHEKGYKMYSPSFAGFHWFRPDRPNPGQELYYNARFILDRYAMDKVGVLQRLGGACVDYVDPYGDPVAKGVLKADTLCGLWFDHLNNHGFCVPEFGLRFDLFKDHGLSESQLGLRTGQMAKGILRNPRIDWAALYDWNGAQGQAIKGKADFQKGLRAGIR